jgi:stress response protein YsnF
MGDTESGEFREHDPAAEGVAEPGGDLDDEDELRVQRSEEELRAGTREREAGALNVRKRVVTEHQRMEVPTRRKDVVEDTETVEEDVRREEVDVDEGTTGRTS